MVGTWSKIQSWWSWYWIEKWTFIDFWHYKFASVFGIWIVYSFRWLTYFNRGSGFQKSSSRAATCYVISVISGARRGSSSDVDASSASAGISLAVTNSEPTDLASLASSTNKICWFWHTLKNTWNMCFTHPIMMEHKKYRLTFPSLTFSSDDDRNLLCTVAESNEKCVISYFSITTRVSF